MRFPFVVVLLAALGFNTAQAEIYKCTVEGRPVFAQTPCGTDDIQVIPNAWQPSEEDVAQQKQANRSVVNSTLQMQYVSQVTRMRNLIREVDETIEDLREKCDERLSWLRYERSRANNNLAGAIWENTIVTEMINVKADYDRRIGQLLEARAEAVRKLENFETQAREQLDASLPSSTK
ncbi:MULTISPECIES: DUF4124 domain-containing protein [Pseudomonas nitroreducens/multiresinivorans group]|uniref:DUF4124 domain-containing protein n=1 Tax=Pseudomonas multiresinivorans TaxID=95301 RepID=A0A7Z3GQQ1_9PSED|nr:DUF4124 domain-containing protein [Pseudomonas multiresinivorans]QJP09450.1 DUF4124 domain-containing protein [Pseudomonas multiresinivorans]